MDVLYLTIGLPLVFMGGVILGGWLQKRDVLRHLEPALIEAYQRGYKQAIADISESSKKVKSR